MRTRSYRFYSLFLLFLLNTFANDWNPMSSPFGGTITALGFNSQNHIYAGSFSGVYKSTDGGDTWEQVSPQTFKSFTRITSIQVDENDHIWVAGYGDGIYRSTDNGSTWEFMSAGLNAAFIDAFIKTTAGNLLAANFSNVFKSTDMGQTWNQLTSFPVGANASTFFIDQNNNIYAGSYSGAIRSSDEGENWETINDGLQTPSVSSFASFSTSRADETVYAATRGEGIYKWDNSQSRWIQMAITGLASLFINSIVVNSVGDIFAATESGLFSLPFNSGTWLQFGMGNLIYTYFALVAINKLGHVYAAKDWDGIYRSKDNGANWTAITNLLTAYSVFALSVSQAYGALLMGSDYAFFTYLFAAGIWQVIQPPYPFFWPTAVAATAAYIFVGTFFDGLYRYNIATQTWLKLTNGLAVFGVTALLIDTLGKLYVGSSNGVFVSENNGDSFVQLGSAALFLAVTSMVINNLGVLFIGTSNNGVYYWDTVSTAWVQVIAGLTALNITALALDFIGNLYASTGDGGIFKSTNQGLLWTAVNVGLVSLFISDLIFRKVPGEAQNNSLIAATGDGVYQSTDQGATWSSLNTGLGGNLVTKFAADSTGVIYAGTKGGGIFTYGAVTSVNHSTEGKPTNFELSQNYPNPFNPLTKIKISIAEPGLVKLSVFNSLGQKVKDLISYYMQTGTYEINFDAEEFSSGTYFYRLVTNNFSQTRKMVLLK